MTISRKNLLKNIFSIILILLPGLLWRCGSDAKNDPTGEWRLSAARREAPFGGRADRIKLPEDAVFPIYYLLERNGAFRAESSRHSVKGTWSYTAATGQIILLSEDKKTDTLMVISANESLKLENPHHTPEGLIVFTYEKE
ncbi:MAG: hypothetical protein CVU06_02870 [Bacteroidetes bacterium HGW-Bacteroidetes-22]|nr:MAG: hypothetical protein CVU06_02870 [Bacteroidetes bacterium HGW-Bacteroidetes-22]